MKIFNEYSLTVTGIMFEILGTFILTIEAYGSKWLENPIKIFIKFSNWVRSYLITSLLIVTLYMAPLIAGAFFGNKICETLFLPALIFSFIIPNLLDDAEKLEVWALSISNNKKVGPKGFLLLLIGSILQLISTIIQIK